MLFLYRRLIVLLPAFLLSLNAYAVKGPLSEAICGNYVAQLMLPALQEGIIAVDRHTLEAQPYHSSVYSEYFDFVRGTLLINETSYCSTGDACEKAQVTYRKDGPFHYGELTLSLALPPRHCRDDHLISPCVLR